ncbi:rod shape-determining protein MreC [Sphingomonas sp.]|uniref:rod shape-determining protein MreC n=1 Tax=Sphingomonas sp. TaxID=28214 RepID=UPI002DD62991|nr:rod shape-determining protein MreC [Sphingomonas sp.]
MAPPIARRTGFSRRAQFGVFIGYVAAATGVAVGAILVLLSTFNPPAFAAVRASVAELTTPVSSALHWVRRSTASLGSIGDHVGGANRIRALEKQRADDAAVVLRARTMVQENHRLRRLLTIRDADGPPIIAARLVSSTAASTRRFATLNAGRMQGVRPGQPVRGPEGLIGRVIETGLNTARVLLVTDAESVVPVRRTRDGLPAMATGRGDAMIDIRSAGALNAPFVAGDLFVTSGAGGIYPPGIPVANVTANARDAALARPRADPDSLDFAFVYPAFLPAPPRATPPETER